MLRKLSLVGAAFAVSASALLPATPAAAQSYGRHYDQGGYRDGYSQNGYDQRGYDQRGYDQRSYHGQDRRYANRNRQRGCDNTAGTLLGAIAGGLLGSSIAGRGDRTLGALLGGAGGALAGRSIDRADDPYNCRR
ncbi:hypothetical protein BH09PSE4_BH09PSE4_06740 [soil metagenome]